MASTANHFSLFPPTIQTASSTTPKLNTNFSQLHCFQSSKCLSPRSSIELNRKCVSSSSAGQGRSLRVYADSTQVTDQFTTKVEHGVPTIVEVDLGNRSYPIYIGSGLLDKPELLQRHVHGKRVLVVTNDTIAPLYLDKVLDALTSGKPNISVENVILPDGEQYKDMVGLLKVMDKAPRNDLGQPDTFVALGGGVIGDICGFAASLYIHGINFIQIPTTVMAQVDSSLGGKTGIKHGFSVVNTVCQPQSVLIDTDTLNTLPDRELASGFAEVIKYGLIRDAQFFEWQEKNMQALMARDPSALAHAIKRSCENKVELVSLDEKESGLRATVNLGHTFGDAIENWVGYGQWLDREAIAAEMERSIVFRQLLHGGAVAAGMAIESSVSCGQWLHGVGTAKERLVGCGQWLHGEAVAAGMVMAVDLSHRLGWIDESIVHRVHAILKQANLPTAPPENMTVDMFKSVMMVGERVAPDRLLKLILLKGPLGNCVFTGDYDKKALDATLHKFCKS